ncbi:hypothetical protein OU995_13340 [Roseateles sp. SL47]|nr:hypothetical protein [Roseateles sp. SL47]WAC75615.1 hypothetical protein OU995_13340 [Roseateles sp. SL47]
MLWGQHQAAAQAMAVPMGECPGVVAVQGQLAGAGAGGQGQGVQQGRLAGAGGADQGDLLPGMDLQGQRLDEAAGACIQPQAFQGKQGHGDYFSSPAFSAAALMPA